MNKRDLIAAIAEDTGTDKKTADTFLTSFVDVVTANVAKGDLSSSAGSPSSLVSSAPPAWVATPRPVSRSRSRRRARSG